MKISIIIPIFNADAFLEQCISSVLEQTYDDFELILINDGSTDQSGEICEKFAAGDYRIKLFHKGNGGVSSARNLGLQVVTGQWITFVDSDDYLTLDYLKAFSEFFETDTDLIIQGQNSIGKSRDEIRISYSFENQSQIAPYEFLNRFNILPFYFGVWCKAFKTEIIKSNKITFDTNKSLGEDTLFNLEYLSCCKSDITLLDRNEYVYRDVEGSLTKQKLSYQQRKELFEDLKRYFNKLSSNKKHYYFYSAELIRGLYTDQSVTNKAKELKSLIRDHKPEIMTTWNEPGLVSKTIYRLMKSNQIFLLDLIFKRLFR